MVASQATEAGSIPVPCSKTKQHPMGCCFCVRNRERKSNPFHASARWALAVRQLDAERSLRFAPKGKSAIDSRTLLQNKTASHWDAVLFWKKRKGIEPIQCKCPVGTCRSAAGCRTLLTICPQEGKPAIDSRTLKVPQQGAALWFLSIAQLRCGAYTNRIQIERKVRSFL